MSALPYLKFAGPVIDEATIAGVGDVLRSGHIASGPWVRRFEASLSEFCGGRPVRVLTSATAAVEVALQLAGIGPGDEVITCAQSFFTVLNMIVKVGATPVFVDCDLVTRNLDLAAVEAAITPRTRAIMPTYWPGSLPDLDAPPCARPQRASLRVIEDAALVMGSQWQGPQRRRRRRPRHVQLSSEQEHHVDRRRRARRRRTRPKRRASKRCASTASSTWPTARATSPSPAASSTCPTSTRASGMRNSSSCRNSCATRRALAERYFERFATRPGVRAAAAPATGRRPVVEHVERAAAADAALDRPPAIPRCARGARRSAPVYRTRRCTCRRSAARTAAGRASFPNAERIARETVTLPLHAAMSAADVDRVCGAVADIIAAARA